MKLAQTLSLDQLSIANGLEGVPPSLLEAKAFPARLPACVDDVIITSEFEKRRARNASLALELHAFKHLTNFLSAEPLVVLNELAAILVQVCDAGSAGVTLQERRLSADIFQCASAAGQLASERHTWVHKHSPSGVVIARNRAEVFRKPERIYSSLRHESLTIKELLVVPWPLRSGRKGAVWVAIHDEEKHFDAEDLRLVTTLADFARHALERSLVQEARCSAEALASAARLANQLAHELNNPLQALINSLYLASPAPEDQHVLEARVQADRLAELVSSGLEVKRQG